MNEPASAVYEIVYEETAVPKRFLRGLGGVIANLLAMRDGPSNSGGMIASVRHKQTRVEVFRHVEDLDDDEGHLVAAIENDLATMTAHEFKAQWVTS